jgi:hypothetical protein
VLLSTLLAARVGGDSRGGLFDGWTAFQAPAGGGHISVVERLLEVVQAHGVCHHERNPCPIHGEHTSSSLPHLATRQADLPRTNEPKVFLNQYRV